MTMINKEILDEMNAKYNWVACNDCNGEYAYPNNTTHTPCPYCNAPILAPNVVVKDSNGIGEEL